MNPRDFGQASVVLDDIIERVGDADLADANEAQTRYEAIDRLVRDVFGWDYGSVAVEEHATEPRNGYVDYLLRSGDECVVVEAKRLGAAFPAYTRARQLKLSGALLSQGEIAKAIDQARDYARGKGAQLVVVTNGRCWCYFMSNAPDDGYAALAFPLDSMEDAKRVFDTLAFANVRDGSIARFSATPVRTESRLLDVIDDADDRLDRNSVADLIVPALNEALYADALLTNVDSLARCFVATEARSKFDSQLNIQLADPRPAGVGTASRIRTGRRGGELEKMVTAKPPDRAPPVTLIIGTVGAGKSTYLKHFELVAAAKTLKQAHAHWIYIDFEAMGPAGQPRDYMYRALRDYIAGLPDDEGSLYNKVIAPAYEADVSELARGPLAPIFTDKTEFKKRVADHIQRDWNQVEPYVDKVIAYLARESTCVVVLDNVDLYGSLDLEKAVFGEGLALSKRVKSHVIVSIRDSTYVRHKADSVFDAYELRRLWLDPPPFDAVLSTRLTYARKLLEGVEAELPLPNEMRLRVPDMAVFFDAVRSSVLDGPAGQFIVDLADINIRRGLKLVNNFLLSGHIQADRVLQTHVSEGGGYRFPFHEVFKGATLGQWKHFREGRAECVNLFDSRHAARRLLLLRLQVLTYVMSRLSGDGDAEVPGRELVDAFAPIGADTDHLVGTLNTLQQGGLVRTVGGEDATHTSVYSLTRTGAYYLPELIRRFVYVDECLLDTAIHSAEHWERLEGLSRAIESERKPSKRVQLRTERLEVFMTYLAEVEAEDASAVRPEISVIPQLRLKVMTDAARAIESAQRGQEW